MQKIYILKTTIAGQTFVKIGRSSNPAARAKGVQTGCPMPVEIHSIHECENAMRVEHDCHLSLRKTNTSGEWFCCSISDAERIVALAIENKTQGRMRKRYGFRPKRTTESLAFFSDSLDKVLR